MFISFLGYIIHFFYSITGNSSKLNSLDGYPYWYQRIVIKEAARQSCEDQIRVIKSQE